jgi:hypothetical protein
MLQDKGKKLAVDFLDVKDAKLERYFLVLNCARQSPKINISKGKVTIFLALGGLSVGLVLSYKIN